MDRRGLAPLTSCACEVCSRKAAARRAQDSRGLAASLLSALTGTLTACLVALAASVGLLVLASLTLMLYSL